jgi:hypothetical protein
VNVLDRIRTARAAWAYDYWLELYSVPGRRRRELRTELRDNLGAAAAQRGMTAALAGIGPVRDLARAAGGTVGQRPLWVRGGYAALATFCVMVVVNVLTAVAFADGALAAGADAPVHGHVFPWWQQPIVVDPTDPAGGFSIAQQVSPLFALVPGVVLVLWSRPWRLRTRLPGAERATAQG